MTMDAVHCCPVDMQWSTTTGACVLSELERRTYVPNTNRYEPYTGDGVLRLGADPVIVGALSPSYSPISLLRREIACCGQSSRSGRARRGMHHAFTHPALRGMASRRRFRVSRREIDEYDGLSQHDIDDVIKHYTPHLRYRYQREVILNPTLSGELVVAFTIGQGGLVSASATESSTVNSPRLEGCVNDVFGEMVFPEPPEGELVAVSYRLLFSLK